MREILTVKDRIALWLILISVLLMLLDYTKILSPLRFGVESFFILPFKTAIFKLSDKMMIFPRLVMQYPEISQMSGQVLDLKTTNNELEFENGLLKIENTELRKQLGSSLPSSYQFIPAQVLGYYSDILEVRSGEREGVKVGMPVIHGLSLVGKVTQVSEYRASVAVSSNSQISVAGATSRGAKGVVVGQSGGNIVFDKVLQKDPLFLDDQIFTTGEGGYPPNLLIGKIAHISSSDEAVYKKAKVEPYLNVQREKTVFIIAEY